MVIATDSRLRFGCAWDCGPKVFSTPRSDLAIAFAGDTLYAYPLILHLIATIQHHSKLRSRAMDLFELRGHAVRIFSHLHKLISDLPKGQAQADEPDTRFILAGYSWKKKRFVVWTIRYESYLHRFTFSPLTQKPNSGLTHIGMTGDYVSDAKALLARKLKEKGKLKGKELVDESLDFEPLEVLRDMIRSGKYNRIGGAPQIFKVYEHMNCEPYAVYWPNRKSGKVALLGRPLLPYEVSQRLVLDPDALTTHIEISKNMKSKISKEVQPAEFRADSIFTSEDIG